MMVLGTAMTAAVMAVPPASTDQLPNQRDMPISAPVELGVTAEV